jgi:hypothetical protein
MSAPQYDFSNANARAAMVNRVHRVVRAEALTIQAQKAKKRSMWAPIAIASTLLIACGYAMWMMLDGYDLTPNGVPDASDQISILVLWALPVTSVVLAALWFKRTRDRSNEVSR